MIETRGEYDADMIERISRAVEANLKAAAEFGADVLAQVTPVQTGHLRSSVHAKQFKHGWRTDVDYYFFFLDKGTTHISKRDISAPLLDKYRDQFYKIMTDGVM